MVEAVLYLRPGLPLSHWLRRAGQSARGVSSLYSASQLREDVRLDLTHAFDRPLEFSGETAQRHRVVRETARPEDAAFTQIENCERVDEGCMAMRRFLRIDELASLRS